MLAQDPGREVVFGAVTQPWAANVVFRAAAKRLAKFQEPGFVKTVWTLRVDPIGATESMASTETRSQLRTSFRARSFAAFARGASPGMFLVRCLAKGCKRRSRAVSGWSRFKC